jgi:hypothetical protein
MRAIHWLWHKFLTRPPRRLPGYFGGSLACSMIVLFALPFTLGLGDPYWWAWIPLWAAVVAGFLWWYGWLPRGRTTDVP